MSYDLRVATHEKPGQAELDSWLRDRESFRVEGSIEEGGLRVTRRHGKRFEHSFELSSPTPILDPEDIDEELAGSTAAPRWFTEISAPYDLPDQDYAAAWSLAKHLAQEFRGLTSGRYVPLSFRWGFPFRTGSRATLTYAWDGGAIEADLDRLVETGVGTLGTGDSGPWPREREEAPMRSRIGITSLALAAVLSLVMAGPSTAGIFTVSPLTVVSGPSPFAGCSIAGQPGTNFLNSEVEPWVEVNPTDPSNVIGVWQQDRWSNGGARGLVTAVTHDGGASWSTTFPHFSTCAGGTAANGGNYERASDPWVTFSPNGDAYQISLSVNFVQDPVTAILVSKSTDGGDTWTEPITLARDPIGVAPFLFHDKESLTADPTDPRFVYAVWDRSRFPSDRANFNAQNAFSFRGDIMFARTVDAGTTWEPARAVFEPLKNQFTIGHQVVVQPDGDLFDFFTLFQGSGNNPPGASLAYIASTDHGATWSDPTVIRKIRFIGAFDPDTGLPIRAEGFVPEVAVDPTNGNLYVTWQDTRFAGVDQIAFTMSTDNGTSWSDPVQVSQTPDSADVANEQAWVPAVDVAGGTIVVTYYDFRNNTAAPGVPTDHWMVHCHSSCADAGNWGDEVRLTDVSFDIEQAPFARGPNGFFVGEYQGLSSAGSTFWPLFTIVNDGNTANRTDIVVRTAS